MSIILQKYAFFSTNEFSYVAIHKKILHESNLSVVYCTKNMTLCTSKP